MMDTSRWALQQRATWAAILPYFLPVSVSSESVKMPCLPSDRGAHAVCLHIVDVLLLNEEGVLFHLIHSRDDLYIFAQVGQNGRVEVGYADGFRQSVLAGFLNATIHSKIIAHRLIQQNQINRDHIQLFQRGFHRLISDLLVLHILDPDLGPDEQFLTGGQAICDGTGHTFA